MTKTILALVIVVSVVSQVPSPRRGETRQPQQSQTGSAKRPTASNQRGTEESPLFIKEIPTQKTQQEVTEEAKDRAEKAANDRKLVEFTKWLVIATLILSGVGLFQLFVFGWQARYLRETVEAAGEQSVAMERAIGEANRSASAMEEVAAHIEASIKTAAQQSESMKESVIEAGRLASAMEVVAKEIAVSSKAAMASVAAINQQMRAYLCVVIGSAVYQDKANNLKFQALPSIVNAGLTPAHKVSFSANAAILPIPLPADFAFPLPAPTSGTSVIGPRQNITVSPIVEDFCDDSEIEGIKHAAQGKALYAWGIFTYEDIFGNPQYTKFCQIYTWLQDGKTTWGYYADRHNDAS